MTLTLWELELFITGIMVGIIISVGVTASVLIYFHKKGA